MCPAKNDNIESLAQVSKKDKKIHIQSMMNRNFWMPMCVAVKTNIWVTVMPIRSHIQYPSWKPDLGFRYT